MPQACLFTLSPFPLTSLLPTPQAPSQSWPLLVPLTHVCHLQPVPRFPGSTSPLLPPTSLFLTHTQLLVKKTKLLTLLGTGTRSQVKHTPCPGECSPVGRLLPSAGRRGAAGFRQGRPRVPSLQSHFLPLFVHLPHRLMHRGGGDSFPLVSSPLDTTVSSSVFSHRPGCRGWTQGIPGMVALGCRDC